MSWKIIVIKNGESTSLFLNNLVVKQINNNLQIPLGDINVVIYENYKTNITTRILAKLAEYKILTIICDENLMPACIMQPYKGNFQQQKIIRDQLNWTNNQKLIFWTYIVKSKLESQIDILKKNNKPKDRWQIIFNYIDEIKKGDPTNREAHAAKIYFNTLFGNNFKRDDENHINSALNFGYIILRSAFCRAIVSKGLHPTISLFHHNKYNSFALADDLMEPFRPIVDDFVYLNITQNDYFSRNDKIGLINLLNSQIIFNSKKVYLTQAINEYVDKVINHFEKNDFQNFIYPLVSSVEYYEL
ncbi:type II CRISPR-associated endonuclease Cas1 [Spiroplasma endosymbiont of Cantharis nigra]|uniref:type II CRISPR-associated endonuclease Cas1 n=1 Tax=Spiroplasma endosymbiont of Cantharis nigra TaxID=3066278 RepID=UPI0030CC8881